MRKLGAIFVVVYLAACSTGETVVPTVTANVPHTATLVSTQTSVPPTDTPVPTFHNHPYCPANRHGGWCGKIRFYLRSRRVPRIATLHHLRWIRRTRRNHPVLRRQVSYEDPHRIFVASQAVDQEQEAGRGLALSAVETILQKIQESVMFDRILKKWDKRWIASGLRIVKLCDRNK